MEKRKKKVAGIVVILVCLIMLGVIYFIPYVKALKVKGFLLDYEYTVYSDYVEINKYIGNKKEVKMPTYIWGRKVKEITSSAFSRNKSIENVILPEYLEIINIFAFEKCESLKKIEMPDTLRIINNSAFEHCINLEEIVLNEGLEIINDGAFESNKKLLKVIIPKSVKEIGENAFAYSGLKEICFESDSIKIGNLAFYDTQWLTLQHEEFVICGDSVLIWYKGNDKEVIIPQGVKALSGTFWDAKEVEKVYIPNTVTYIDEHTFGMGENITVYIPESVTEIESKSIIFNPENIRIITTAGSYAESFAKENGMKCEIVDMIEYPEM